MTKQTKKGNFNCRNWKSCTWKHTITPRSIRERWDEPFVVSNFFPYDAVELRDEATNRIFK
ncbi:hypothetical protein CR513_35473, partial [Mucuna pruriens]